MPNHIVDGGGIRADRTHYTLPVELDPMEEARVEAPEVMADTIAVFRAMYGRISTTKSGDLVITFIVPKVDKMAAMKVSDFPSKIFDIAVSSYTNTYSAEVKAALEDLGVLGTADVLPGADI